MYDFDTARRRSRTREDVFRRRRFSQHNRAMAVEGQGDRNAEMRLAKEQIGRDFTKGELGVWHKYVTRGGRRPSGGGYSGGEAPVMGEAPELDLPEYDERKVSALTQKRSASGVRRLRETTQRAMDQSYENPNVKKMTVRDALAGYGTGLESVMAGAGRAATQEYGQQYATSVNAEMARYRGALNRRSQEYQTASNAWLMEREYELKDDYDDPYAEFEDFYN